MRTLDTLNMDSVLRQCGGELLITGLQVLVETYLEEPYLPLSGIGQPVTVVAADVAKAITESRGCFHVRLG